MAKRPAKSTSSSVTYKAATELPQALQETESGDKVLIADDGPPHRWPEAQANQESRTN